MYHAKLSFHSKLPPLEFPLQQKAPPKAAPEALRRKQRPRRHQQLSSESFLCRISKTGSGSKDLYAL